MASKRFSRSSPSTSWDPVAEWYAGWVGSQGSQYHQQLAIPEVLDLLQVQTGEHVLDIGCGPGVLAAPLANSGAYYTGIDASRRLIAFARKHHGAYARFLVGDASRLNGLSELDTRQFDAAIFMLSIQDMEPLDCVLSSASWALHSGGRIIVLLTHPCFRVPRQSGWGWDDGRQLRYRRIDRYLTPLAVPMKAYRHGSRGGRTRSFHRPLQHYVNGLAEQGFLIDRMHEIPTYHQSQDRASRLSNDEIPLFLAMRAIRQA